MVPSHEHGAVDSHDSFHTLHPLANHAHGFRIQMLYGSLPMVTQGIGFATEPESRVFLQQNRRVSYMAAPSSGLMSSSRFHGDSQVVGASTVSARPAVEPLPQDQKTVSGNVDIRPRALHG